VPSAEREQPPPAAVMAAAGLNGSGDARKEQEGQSDRSSEPPVSSAKHEQPSPEALAAAGNSGDGDARTGQAGQSDKPLEPSRRRKCSSPRQRRLVGAWSLEARAYALPMVTAVVLASIVTEAGPETRPKATENNA
jgi:hypothetical protein